MSLPPVRTGMTGGCHYARPLTLCSGLISGAVIKMLPQISTEGKRRLFGLQLQVVIYPSGEITVAGLQEAGHISSQGQKETDARMASCLLGSAPFLYSYTVQEFLLREWCCPHWAGIFPYQLTQDNAQQTCSQANLAETLRLSSNHQSLKFVAHYTQILFASVDGSTTFLCGRVGSSALFSAVPARAGWSNVATARLALSWNL